MRTHGLFRVASWQNEKLEWQCSCYASFDSPQRLVDHMCGVRHKHHVTRYRAALKRASVAERRVEELEAELAKFHPCDEGICMIDESTHEYREAEEHPFKVWHREQAGDGLLW